MLQEIHKSSRFKKDYERYYSAIAKLPEGDFKSKMSSILMKLVNEIKKLDGLHSEMVYTKQLPSMGNEIKLSVSEMRKELESNLSKYLDNN
jgi:hypothetical protein